jgi:hypothetical protein
MNISSDVRVQSIFREVKQARERIEAAPVGDSFEFSSGKRVELEGFKGQVRGEQVSATLTAGESTVELRSEVYRKDTTGLQVAAGLVGALVGALLGGDDDGPSLGLGALLGGAAAVGAGALAASSEQVITRVETNAEGVTTETVKVGPESSLYSKQWQRTGPAPEVDPEAVKEFIANVEI